MASPYYQFGYQKRRYAYDPHGGPGGILPGTRAAETRGLGSLSSTTLSGTTLGDFDIEESVGPGIRYPALSDWPLLRPAGPEPLDPGELGHGRPRAVGAFEDVPGGMATMAVAAAALGWMLLRKKRR